MAPVNKKILKFAPILFLAIPFPLKAATLKVLDPTPKAEFESNRLVSMQDQLKSCGDCKVENITPYDAQGRFDEKQVAEALMKQSLDGAILVINWNRGVSSSDKPLLDHLKKKISDGHVIVAAAGRPVEGSPILPLGKTLWGQLPDSLVIGELQEKEKLVAGTYFGPEMLTALSPRDLNMGEGAGALSFALKMLPEFDKKKSAEWVRFLKEKRSKHRRLWPSLKDLFGK